MSDKEVTYTVPDEVAPLNLEDQLDLKEEELLSGSCGLIKIFQQLQINYSIDDPQRHMGNLDIEVFVEAYRLRKATVDETAAMTRERASEAYEHWGVAVLSSFIQEYPNVAPFRPYDIASLEKLREDFGLTLYRHIRKAFREIRVAAKYGTLSRPWNIGQNKEADLHSLLDSLDLSHETIPWT